MIDLPESTLRKQLNSQLTRGKLLKTEILFPPHLYYKRLILLNNNFLEGDIYYILTTSKTDFFNKWGNYLGVKGNFIYVQKGQTSFNTNEDMIIDCRRIDVIKKEKLLENYKNKKLKFLGNIPKEIITEIDKIISVSRLISPKIKTHIISKYAQAP